MECCVIEIIIWNENFINWDGRLVEVEWIINDFEIDLKNVIFWDVNILIIELDRNWDKIEIVLWYHCYYYYWN